MRIVKKIDPSLLDMQMSLKTQTLSKDIADSRIISVLLDICFIRHSEDGMKYAVNILELIRKLDETRGKPLLFKEIVESVLWNIRASRNAFCSIDVSSYLLVFRKL